MLRTALWSATLVVSCLLGLVVAGWHPPPAGPPASKAVFVYMCGGDLETDAGRASADLAELVASVPSETTVVVQTGGAKAWHGHGIDASVVQRWLVTPDGLQLIEAVASANMASAKAFREFLDFAVSEYRADAMSLVMWGHGTGRSVCEDQLHHYDTLDTAEIRSALVALADDVRFEAVIVDACHAATLDMAVALAGRATYLVASVDKLPGSGLDYAAVDWGAAGRDLAVSAAGSLGGGAADVHMTVIRLDEIPRLADFVAGLELAGVGFDGLERSAVYIASAYFLVNAGDVLPVLPTDKQDALRRLVSKAVVHPADPVAPASGIALVVPRT